MTKHKLFITADDIGAVTSIDFAVQKLIEARIINAISVFVNGNCDISWIQQYSGTVYVGLHLTFSFSRPVSHISDIHLVDNNGLFLMPAKPKIASDDSIKNSINNYIAQFEKASPCSIYTECQAQIDRFREIFGKLPVFINVHHDLDKSELLKSIIKKYFPHFPTRAIKLEKDSQDYRYFYLYQFLSKNETYSVSQKRICELIHNGIHLYKQSDKNEVEIVFHPSLISTDLSDFSSYNEMRYREFCILSQDEIRRCLL